MILQNKMVKDPSSTGISVRTEFLGIYRNGCSEVGDDASSTIATTTSEDVVGLRSERSSDNSRDGAEGEGGYESEVLEGEHGITNVMGKECEGSV